ncbi:MAG: class II aldolase and adducin N-terminal domain-containing protein [Pseudomonadota bacterium]
MNTPNITPLNNPSEEMDHQQDRVELAAAFRWAARYNLHEATANHFSLAVSNDGSQFLCNPNGRHFSRVKASELLLLDANDPNTLNRPDAPDASAWSLHGAVHRAVPHARCALHLHPKYATVLASLKDSTIYPIDQNTMRFFNRIAVDDGFEGMALGDEGDRVCRNFGNKSVMMMGNHGVMVIGPSVAQAFDTLYYLERACETLVSAYMTQKELRIVDSEVAEKTAQQWEEYSNLSELHFRELMAILDEEEPSYRA